MAQVWAVMASHYTNTWTQRYGDAPFDEHGAIVPHARAMIDAMAGLSRQQIDAGLSALVHETSSFPPNPARFRVLCLQIPSIGEVAADLRNAFADRSAFTIMVGHYLDNYAYTRASAEYGERLLRRAYEMAVDKRSKGEPLPKVGQPALVSPEKARPVPATSAVEAWHKENIRRVLEGEPEQPRSTKPTH